MRIGTIGLAGLALMTLMACEREVILPGTRYDVRTPLEDTLPEGTKVGAATPLKPVDPVNPVNRSVQISLPRAQSPADWPQRGLTSTNALPNLALGGSFTQLWAVPIGAGNDRRHQITADPVVVSGRIFTLDSRATVQAHSTSGALLWSRDLTPQSDADADASGGGIAFGDGKLLVTTGFGTVAALDPATGAELWSQRIGAVGNAGPTVWGGYVYVIARDNSAWAIETRNGHIAWRIDGLPPQGNYVGGAGAAVDGRIAVLPFSSGEIVTVLARSGVRSWGTAVTGHRRGRSYALIMDFTSDPVLVGNALYAGNAAGKLARLNAGTGETEWIAGNGSLGNVIVAGGSLFMVSDDNRIVRLDAGTGELIWGIPLPNYVAHKPASHRDVYANFGPLLVNGRLLVASSDGRMRLYDPVSGLQVATLPMPGGAASNPVVAGGTLYVVTTKGELVAFR